MRNLLVRLVRAGFSPQVHTRGPGRLRPLRGARRHARHVARREAFRAITTHSAYQMGTERRTGSLERGKFADYIVLAADPMKVPATDISETKVLRSPTRGG